MSFSRTNKMWSFRFIALVCALLAICQANPLTKNDAHNIYACPNPSGTPVTLVNEPVYERAEFWKIKTKIYKFPKEGVNNVQITCISIQDKAADGSGGYPEIISGGLNQYYIEIKFTSQRGKAIDFNVELYG